MKTWRTVVLIPAALILAMAHPSTSGLVGIYGIIEKVVFEPGDGTPERVQLWGAFAYADGAIGQERSWSPARRGYLYFKLPAASVASTSDLELIKREWADLEAAAGTSQALGFGRWGYIGRFEDVVRATSGPTRFLEWAPGGGAYTDLRVRPATETPSAPAAYQTNAGIVRLTADGSHAELVTQLRAALKR
jgi:hypothetical protein